MGERYLTHVEAARRAGVSKDSIIRARRAGRLPGARLTDGHWEIPSSSLAAAGLQPPGLGETDAAAGRAADAFENMDEGCMVEMAATEAKLAALADLVARQDEELRFLRQLLAEAIANGGRG